MKPEQPQVTNSRNYLLFLLINEILPNRKVACQVWQHVFVLNWILHVNSVAANYYVFVLSRNESIFQVTSLLPMHRHLFCKAKKEKTWQLDRRNQKDQKEEKEGRLAVRQWPSLFKAFKPLCCERQCSSLKEGFDARCQISDPTGKVCRPSSHLHACTCTWDPETWLKCGAKRSVWQVT